MAVLLLVAGLITFYLMYTYCLLILTCLPWREGNIFIYGGQEVLAVVSLHRVDLDGIPEVLATGT